jgi:hypothetical protein
MTAEDRRAQIDRRFDETFAVFDARMRKEQEAVSQERAAGGGYGAGGGSETGEAEGEGSEGAAGGAPGDAEQGDGASNGAGTPGSRGEPAGEQSGTQGGGGGVGGGAKGGAGPNTVPADIPDGRDDDIVARQLREAAMKETDPELRERLWDEYRQYKKSTQ